MRGGVGEKKVSVCLCAGGVSSDSLMMLQVRIREQAGQEMEQPGVEV